VHAVDPEVELGHRFRATKIPRRRKRLLGMREQLAARSVQRAAGEESAALSACALLRRADETRLCRGGPWQPCENLAAAALHAATQAY
jgi:hypothetical protein